MIEWQKEHAKKKNNKQDLKYTHSHGHQQTEKTRPNLKQEEAKTLISREKEKMRSDMREQENKETFRVAARYLQNWNQEQADRTARLAYLAHAYCHQFWDPNLLQRRS